MSAYGWALLFFWGLGALIVWGVVYCLTRERR